MSTVVSLCLTPMVRVFVLQSMFTYVLFGPKTQTIVVFVFGEISNWSEDVLTNLGGCKSELMKLSRFKKHNDGSKATKPSLQKTMNEATSIVKAFEELSGLVKAFLK